LQAKRREEFLSGGTEVDLSVGTEVDSLFASVASTSAGGVGRIPSAPAQETDLSEGSRYRDGQVAEAPPTISTTNDSSPKFAETWSGLTDKLVDLHLADFVNPPSIVIFGAIVLTIALIIQDNGSEQLQSRAALIWLGVKILWVGTFASGLCSPVFALCRKWSWKVRLIGALSTATLGVVLSLFGIAAIARAPEPPKNESQKDQSPASKTGIQGKPDR
jgi:hypothetical protein